MLLHPLTRFQRRLRSFVVALIPIAKYRRNTRSALLHVGEVPLSEKLKVVEDGLHTALNSVWLLEKKLQEEFGKLTGSYNLLEMRFSSFCAEQFAPLFNRVSQIENKLSDVGVPGYMPTPIAQTCREENGRIRIDAWHPSNCIEIVEQDGSTRPLQYQDELPGVFISCKAQNCRISIPRTLLHERFYIEIWEGSDNTHIELQENVTVSRMSITAVDSGGKLCIRSGTCINGLEIVLSGGVCDIGNNCLISTDVLIYTRDTHAIVDPESKEILNYLCQGVYIGHHTWIGRRAVLAKNAVLAPYSIVGMSAVVTKTFSKERTVIAGTPAKAIGSCGVYDSRRESQYIREKESHPRL